MRRRWTPTPRLRTIVSSCHVRFQLRARARRSWPFRSRDSARSSRGCATSDDEGKPVTYSLTAKQNYEKGLAELKDENYPEAQKYFQFVKQKYPFSKYAVLAELAIADTQFARGNYTEAIDSYKSFARLHPTHEKVEDGYVAFRIGESYFKDMPEDVWLLPPSVREGSVGGRRRPARARRLPQEVPELAVHEEGARAAPARC